MEHHKISEYIENLTFRKRVGGVDQEQVFEAIRELSSMYNELLAEAYEENERLKEQLEKETKRNEIRKAEELQDCAEVSASLDERMQNIRNRLAEVSGEDVPKKTDMGTPLLRRLTRL